MARKPADTVQLKLRFPEALRRRLEHEARRRGLSMNAAIISILDDSLRRKDELWERARFIAEVVSDDIQDLVADGIADAIVQAEKYKEREATEAANKAAASTSMPTDDGEKK